MNDDLRALILKHEGCRLFPYTDSVGKLTIGVGYNLTDRGITQQQADDWLDADITSTIGELVAAFPWFAALDDVRQMVLVDMAFNLGLTRLQKFTATLAAVADGRYQGAANHMLASKWSTQVGRRAIELAEMMRTGTIPEETV